MLIIEQALHDYALLLLVEQALRLQHEKAT